MKGAAKAVHANSAPHGLVDVDFSLAIHNRTGKYFIGRDLLSTPDLPVGDVYYWIFAGREPPSGVLGRVMGRLQRWHIHGQALGGPFRRVPARRLRRPLLHLDPFTVPTTHLRQCDAVLCHDIGPVTHPDLFDANIGRVYDHIYRQCARVGPHMIFVSNTTRKAFLASYPTMDRSRTRVIYPTLRAGISAPEPDPVSQIDGPFLLTVGSIGARKNQARCIAAFVDSGLARQGYRYVICGGPEPGFEQVAGAAASAFGVVLLPYVTDAQLSWLYAHARGFVLASLLEGFGMPVAEAIAHGLIPVVSRDSVLHEVAGDSAVLVNPENTASIAAAMVLLNDMGDEQRTLRIAALQKSVDRFDQADGHAAWRHVFQHILLDGNLLDSMGEPHGADTEQAKVPDR